mgnify:CR=1 FL=1
MYFIRGQRQFLFVQPKGWTPTQGLGQCLDVHFLTSANFDEGFIINYTRKAGKAPSFFGFLVCFTQNNDLPFFSEHVYLLCPPFPFSGW